MRLTFSSRSRRWLLLLSLVVSCTPLLPAYGDELSDAKTSLDAAQGDIEKINALYNYARALNTVAETYEQRQKALDLTKQALLIVAKLEQTGQKLNPQSQIHYLAGKLALLQDDATTAVRFFDAADRTGFVADSVKLGGKGTSLFRLRGKAKWEDYDFVGALADLNRAIEREGNKGDYADRARLHFDMGNAAAARADWAKSSQVTVGEQTDYVQAASQRARLDGLSTLEIDAFPFDSNLLPLNLAISQQPRTVSPLLARASYLIRRGAGFSGGQVGELDKAIRDINFALRLERKSSAAYHLLALGLWRLGVVQRTLPKKSVHDAVIQAFNKALHNGNNDVVVRMDIGDYFAARAQLPALVPEERRSAIRDAIFNFSSIIRNDPKNHLARAKRIKAQQLHERPDTNSILVDYAALHQAGTPNFAGALGARETEVLLAEVETAHLQALIQNGELSQAQTALDLALKRDANNPELLMLRGQIYTMRGRYNEAIEDLKKSVSAQRNNAKSWWWLGLALDGAGLSAPAKQALDNAQKIDASLSPFVAGTRYAAQNPTNKPIVMPPVAGELKPQGTPLQHKDAGNALNAKGDVEGSLYEYTTALLIDPNFTDALSNRANVYQRQGTLDLALTDVNRALELEPNHRTASLVRANIRATMGDNAQALEDFSNALRYAEDDNRRITVLSERAHFYARIKDIANVNADIDAAMKLAQNDAVQIKKVEALRAELAK